MQDLVAGQIDMLIDSPTNSLPQVRAGRIKAYAVTAKRRLAAAPDILTVDEAGLPEFYMSSWHALWVPKGTAKSVIRKLNDAVVNALADPAVSERLAHLGQEIFPREQQTSEALARLPQGRDREVVADHQGGEHRGGMNQSGVRFCAFSCRTSERVRHEASAPSISASGSACWRSSCVLSARLVANLSGAAGALDRRLSAGRRRRYSGADGRPVAVGAARPAVSNFQHSVPLSKRTGTKTHPTTSLLAKPTPRNVNFGSDRFAMFNKQAGHPGARAHRPAWRAGAGEIYRPLSNTSGPVNCARWR
jgi:hypothetical protein